MVGSVKNIGGIYGQKCENSDDNQYDPLRKRPEKPVGRHRRDIIGAKNEKLQRGADICVYDGCPKRC